MAWARLDDGFGDHPKVLELLDTLDEMAGAAAIGLWTLGLAYAHRTMRTTKIPGFIPRSFVRSACVPASLGDRLCDAGLWEHAEGGGWLIHDFDQYLPSSDLRSKRAEAGRRGAEARWSKTAAQEPREDETPDGDSNLPSGATMANGKSCPEPEPEPKKKRTTSSSSAGKPAAATKRGTRIPEDFTVTPDMVAWCRQECPGVDGRRETEKFINYWTAKTGTAATKLDWAATWRNWMLNAAERGSSSPGSRAAPPAKRATTDERMDQADAALAELLADRAAGIPLFGSLAADPNAITAGHNPREITS